jgi:diguanylate cyclase (GGDEF)-like protein
LSKILVVDDSVENLELLSAELEAWGHHVTRATSGAHALELAETLRPDLILLDVTMPEMDGIEVCRRLKGSQELKGIPVILSVTRGADEHVVVGLDAGAQDYIPKPCDERILAARVRAQLRLKDTQDALEQRSEDLSRAVQAAEHLATHDSLTGLANRAVFLDQVEKAVHSARRDDQNLALLFIDLDGFKDVNDTLGHATGDALLRSVADRLESVVRTSDVVARLGGDEFTILLPKLAAAQDASFVARKVLRLLSSTHEIDGRHVVATPSIGIAIFPSDGDDSDSLLRNADRAMYEAKSRGKGCYQFFTPEMNRVAEEQRVAEERLAHALVNEEFVLHYQPQLDVVTGAVVGAEALVRWQDPEEGLLLPSEFIPLAEKTGLINPLGEWILRTACLQRQRWNAEGLPSFFLCVNVSPRQLRWPGFVQGFRDLLSEIPLKSDQIQLEVTESCLMSSVRSRSSFLEDLAAMGAAVAVDDFGAGYSSLGLLRQLPVGVVKLDRSFVAGIESDAVNASIASAVVALAKGLEFQVVAGGVETESERSRLLDLGFRIMQGYLFQKPVPATELAEFVRARSGV